MDYSGFNTEVNSYCSFIPGGEYYVVDGSCKLDYNNNGCNPLDISSVYQRINVTDGVNTALYFSNTQGEYSLPLPEGVHTITPEMENSDYFTISPTSITVDFPTDPTPFEQDFCITPTGTHLDLEVVIMPITPARPGFEADYKIIYKNKGNQLQSGEVRLTYNDLKTHFQESVPGFDIHEDNELFWNFTDLYPFETREISMTFNVNGPMDTPPINIGDELGYEALIFPITDDETPQDNESELKQTVVGSMDPNDKTCIQGESVGPEMIGEYVHYLVRFENTGTFAAENVVVKDSIDVQKFDISTLRPLHSSHEFVTRINNNIVEYIFEGINLPFDDENNDGYVLFKIKTLPSLVLGDTFTNDAAIYFDYNFPVITNDYTTLIEEQLGVPDFEFSNEFSIYPNPAKGVLNIQSKGSVLITSLEIYNMLGQLVIAITDSKVRVDVSGLQTGNYMIKINTDKGSSYSKFIKG